LSVGMMKLTFGKLLLVITTAARSQKYVARSTQDEIAFVGIE
jgi:hypothetical protein